MTKVGRNSPCPCGSGKKFKRCCLKTNPGVQRKLISLLDKFFLEHSSFDLLATIGGLQLLPENHGKNIRLESLAKMAVKTVKSGTSLVSPANFKQLLDNELSDHYLEDPVEVTFIQSVCFIGGNYNVFPGISSDGAERLQEFISVITQHRDEIPPLLYERLTKGLKLMLELGNAVVEKLALSRYDLTDSKSSKISFPSSAFEKRYVSSVIFSFEFIDELCKAFTIEKEVVEQFVVDLDDAEFKNNEWEQNPLLYRPLVKSEKGFIWTLPSAQVTTINEFVLNEVNNHDFKERFIDLYYDCCWSRLKSSLRSKSWGELDIDLPVKEDGLSIHEAVYRFDNDKIAYVCYVCDRNIAFQWAHDQSGNYSLFKERDERIEARSENVMAHIHSDDSTFFRVYLLGNLGRLAAFSFRKTGSKGLAIAFNDFDFEKVISSDSTDILSIWKFANMYHRAEKTVYIQPVSSTVDLYGWYKLNHESFFHPDDQRPDSIIIDASTGGEFKRKVLNETDEHAAAFINKGEVFYTPVIRFRTYAPIYRMKYPTRDHSLLLETYTTFIWLTNNQEPVNEPLAFHFLEAIGFWLDRMQPDLKSFFPDTQGDYPISINLSFDSLMMEEYIGFDYREIDADGLAFNLKVGLLSIEIDVPADLLHLLSLSHNEGERAILRSVLRAFSELFDLNKRSSFDEAYISYLLDRYIPLGSAKMILFPNVNRYPRLDTRGLLPLRYIQDSETSYILDNILADLGSGIDVPERIEHESDKVKLCNQIVGVLIEKIVKKLSDFDAKQLLRYFIQLHETCVHQRQLNELKIPARIACFADVATEKERIAEKQRKLVDAALSYRCLIEFVVAQPSFGGKAPNIDEVDEMAALMHQVISWGVTSDSINLGLNDGEIRLLSSGRIGMDKTFFQSILGAFSEARSEADIDDDIAGFSRFFHRPEIRNADNETSDSSQMPDANAINDAFLETYQVSLTKIISLQDALNKISNEHSPPVVSIYEEEELHKKLSSLLEDFTSENIKVALDLLCLQSRQRIDEAPKGYTTKDILPWIYNRRLSFIRKPVVKLYHPDEKKNYYYWGFRHVDSAIHNLFSLIQSGRISDAHMDTKLKSVKAQINHVKGGYFRNKALKWIKENTSLSVIDHEVTIKPKGHLISEKDLGDIDVFAVDHTQKVVYSIECKATLSARIIHEMKSELDNYFGRDGKPGLLHKHVQRDSWLRTHQNLVNGYIGNNKDYSVKSIVLTSEEIPAPFLAKKQPSLPFVSFYRLQREGIDCLRS